MGLNSKIFTIFYYTCDSKLHAAQYIEKLSKDSRFTSSIGTFYTLKIIQISSPQFLVLNIIGKLKSADIDSCAIIFDYQTFPTVTNNNYRIAVRDIILYYPEANFYFDENGSTQKSYIDFLLGDEATEDQTIYKKLNESRRGIVKELHSFTIPPRFKVNPFISLKSFCNLFDYSNLRKTLLIDKYEEANEANSNFESIRYSRLTNPSISADSEKEKSLYSGYLLHSNGYRALPIYDSNGLEFLASLESKQKLVIRDLDFKFGDAALNDESYIKSIRGWEEVNDTITKASSSLWEKVTDSDTITHYVTPDKKISSLTDDYTNKMYLTGIHFDIQKIDLVRKHYLSIAESPINHKTLKDYTTPNDSYNMVSDMIYRGKKYYNEGRYILSAIVSEMALHINNAVFKSLTSEAYHLWAISENAIACSVLGCNEEALAADSKERAKKYSSEICRLKVDDSNNLLNQIFSDCRNFCKEKEHFESEDVFIGAMAQLNDGCYIIPKVWQKCKTIYKHLVKYI